MLVTIAAVTIATFAITAEQQLIGPHRVPGDIVDAPKAVRSGNIALVAEGDARRIERSPIPGFLSRVKLEPITLYNLMFAAAHRACGGRTEGLPSEVPSRRRNEPAILTIRCAPDPEAAPRHLRAVPANPSPGTAGPQARHQPRRTIVDNHARTRHERAAQYMRELDEELNSRGRTRASDGRSERFNPIFRTRARVR